MLTPFFTLTSSPKHLLCARRFLAVLVAMCAPFAHLLHHPTNIFCVHPASWLILFPC